MPSVLLVDDDENDVLLFERAMKRIAPDIVVTHKVNGKAAKEHLAVEQNHPDLILSDNKMPLMSGIELFRWIRSQPQYKTVPMVMWSSSSRGRDAAEAEGAGADQYMLKTGDMVEACVVLRDFMRSYGLVK